MPKKCNASAKKNTGSGARPAPCEVLEAECRLLREDIVQMQTRLEQRVLDATLDQSALKAAQNHRALTKERATKREAVLGAGMLALGAQHDDLSAQLTDLTEQVSHLKNDLEAARAEIDAIYNSRSWKITKPMRAVRQGLNKT